MKTITLKWVVVVLFLSVFAVGTVFGADYYVAPPGPPFYGDDYNSGMLDAPWATIQKAGDTLSAGDTAYVRVGTYNARVVINVSGSAVGGYITIRNYPGESPIIDGTGLIVGEGWDQLILIDSKPYIIINGFELKDFTTAEQYHNPIGIFVTGSSNNIELRNLKIHNIEANFDNGDKWMDGADAHGIAVYGTEGTEALRIHDITIDNVEIYDCVLGSSESLVLNGNVDGFVVSNSVVHDNNNIGMDFIGYEGKCPNEDLDRARNGIVRDNNVYNISSYGNPSYWGGKDWERCADGIYVDGGTNILIDRNISTNNDIGIELASEWKGKTTDYITVRNNFVTKSYMAGLMMGGYDKKRGSTAYCKIVNNTFYKNSICEDGYWGEIHFQYAVHYNELYNNLVWAGPVGGVHFGSSFRGATGNSIDYNTYYTTNPETTWVWNTSWISSFADWQDEGHDTNGQFANPLLIDPENGDFHIPSNSPAKDAGTNSADHGDYDLDGEARIYNIIVDAGADEYHP